MDIGKRLKELRLEKKLIQAEVAEILNISRNTYTQYENNTRSISIELLIKLADYYNVSLDYVVGRDDWN